MRTEVRICFTTKTLGGAHEILGAAGCGPDVATVTEVPVLRHVDVWVTLEETDPRIPVLRELIERHGRRSLEFHEDRYTEEELDSAPLLILEPTRACEACGGVEYGMTYDLSGACPACGTGGRQTSAVFVDGEDLAKLEAHRAGATIFFHILVDEGLAEDLENLGATGLSFRSVYALMPDKRQVKLRRKQLCAARTLPPMSPRTTGLTRDRACEVCWRNGYFQTSKAPTRIVYRAADLRDADDVNLTWENLGYAILKPELRESLLSYQWMLVTPKVRRVFLAAGITSFDWLPIRVEETEGASRGGEAR
jgi:hypothetical protein